VVENVGLAVGIMSRMLLGNLKLHRPARKSSIFPWRDARGFPGLSRSWERESYVNAANMPTHSELDLEKEVFFLKFARVTKICEKT